MSTLTDRCPICEEPLKPDDLCQIDIEMGTVHAACCGSDREGYVHLDDGTPLAADEPLPEPFRYGNPA